MKKKILSISLSFVLLLALLCSMVIFASATEPEEEPISLNFRLNAYYTVVDNTEGALEYFDGQAPSKSDIMGAAFYTEYQDAQALTENKFIGTFETGVTYYIAFNLYSMDYTFRLDLVKESDLKIDVPGASLANMILNGSCISVVFELPKLPERLNLYEAEALVGGEFVDAAVPGDKVTLKPVNNDEYKRFSYWEIYGLDTEGMDLTNENLSFTMPKNEVSVSAIYVDLYSINVNGCTAYINGVEVDRAAEGDEITVVADSATEGFYFDGWETNGTVDLGAQAKNENITFAMPANPVDLTAVFREMLTIDISYYINDGSVSVAINGVEVDFVKDYYGYAKPGDTITVTAKPNAGYKLKNWDGSSDFTDLAAGKGSTFAFTMPDSYLTIGAEFEIAYYGIDVNDAEVLINESIDYSAQAKLGDNITLTANDAPSGKRFSHWVFYGVELTPEQEKSSTISFKMPEEDIELYPVYVFVNLGITVENATVTVNGTEANKADELDRIEVIANEAAAGSIFEKWDVEGLILGDAELTNPHLTFDMPGVAITLTPIYHTHTYSDAWSIDGDNHWHQCVNPACPNVEHSKKDIAMHDGTDDFDCSSSVKCSTCEKELVAAKSHNFSGEWQEDADGHWFVCQNSGCSVADEKNEHTPNGDDGNCTTAIRCTACGYATTAAKTHDFSGAWATSGTQHWHVCQNAGCNQTDEKTAHSGGTASCGIRAKCEKCGTSYGDYDENVHEGTLEWVTNNYTHLKHYSGCNHIIVAVEDHEWEDGVCTECEFVCKHAGGEATCKTQRTCTICGERYGELHPYTHEGEVVWVTTATTHKRVYNCCEYEVSASASHTWSGGKCIVCEYECVHTPAADDNNCSTPIKCTVCQEITTAAKTHDFSGEWQKDESGHWHVCENDGCNVTDDKKNHVEPSTDYNCETEVVCVNCGYVTVAADTHDFDGVAWGSDGMKHWRECKHTGCTQKEENKHSGGTASCINRPNCEYCGAAYGSTDSSNHEGEATWKTTQTTHEMRYYDCCDKVVVSEETHRWSDGKCTDCNYECEHTPDADDGNCVSPIKCTNCRIIITAAKTHDFSGEWQKDESGHWHVCANSGCNVTDTKTGHVSASDDSNCETALLCPVCAYALEEALTHNFSEVRYNATHHWFECSNGGCSVVDSTGEEEHIPAADDGDCTTRIRCSVCACSLTTGELSHNFGSSAFQHDADSHWQVCQRDGCEVIGNEAAHTSSGSATPTSDEICTVCKRVLNSALGYTITYTDGVADVVVFADQVYNSLAVNSKTPAFVGTPARAGYIFAGWSPAVADTVTGSVTYTATWLISIESITVTCPGYVFGGDIANAIPQTTTEGITIIAYEWLDAGRWELKPGQTFGAGTHELWLYFEIEDGYGYNSEELTTHDITICGYTPYSISFGSSFAEDGDICIMGYVPSLVAPSYTVTFDGNGATGSMDPITAVHGSKLALPDCIFTVDPTQKFFRAWLVDGEIKNIGDRITVTKDTVVQALWYEYITAIDIVGLKAPIGGQTPTASDVTITPSGKFTIEFNEWLTIGSSVFSGTFKAGTDYLVYIKLIPNDGYWFADSLNTAGITIDNGTLFDVSAYRNQSCSIKIRFTSVSPLSFADSSSFDIPAGLINTAINAIDLSTGVSGGVAPYTFSILHDYSTEKWLSVSADGKITGTRPATAQAEATLCIQVTDAIGQTDSIYVAIGSVNVAHTEQTLSAKAATCTESGLTEGKKCSVCGEILVAQETVPAKGHTYGAEYSADKNYHWFDCIDPECSDKADGVKGKEEHVPGPGATYEAAQVCTVCDYEIAAKLQAKTVTVISGKAQVGGVDITNGTPVLPGTVVTIIANEPPVGMYFNCWGSNGGITLDNVNSATTTFVMGTNNVTVTAYYGAYTIIGGGTLYPEFSVPITGFKVEDARVEDVTTKWTATVIGYYDGETKLNPTDAFVQGRTYTVDVRLTANAGYLFDADATYKIKHDVYDTEAIIQSVSETEILCRFTYVAKTAITSLNINFQTPVSGNAASYVVTVPDDAPYTVHPVVYWYDFDNDLWYNADLAQKLVFEIGSEYGIEFELIPKDGYIFADDVEYDPFVFPEGVIDGGQNAYGETLELYMAYVCEPNPITATVTVEGGTAWVSDGENWGSFTTGSGPIGTRIWLEANEPEEGKTFLYWEVVSGKAVINYPYYAGDVFFLVTEDVVIRAVYTDDVAHSITVKGGTASATTAKSDETIWLTAGAAPEGKYFYKWVVKSGGVYIYDSYEAETGFTMTGADVEVEAIFLAPIKDIVLNVNGVLPTVGGSGDYTITIESVNGSTELAELIGIWWEWGFTLDSTLETEPEWLGRTGVVFEAGYYVIYLETWSDIFFYDEEFTLTLKFNDGTATGECMDYASESHTWADFVVLFDLSAPAHTHTEVTVPGKAATCTESGLTDGKKCSECGETLVDQQPIEALGHSVIEVEGKAATCTTDGYKAHYKCTVCEALYADEECTDEILDLETWQTYEGYIEAAHTFGEWQEEIPATTESEGTKAHYHCSVCQKNFDEDGYEIADLSIPKLEDPTTPEETTPEETTPEESTPEETTPEETTPEESTPEESTPEETTPEETTPEESTPEVTTPEETQPEQPTEEPKEEPQEEPKKGLSGGAIAGIVVGSTVVVGAGGFSIFWFVIQKKDMAELIEKIKKLFSKK